MRQGGQEGQGAEHVPQEHEGQHQSHVGLEFYRRQDPGADADGERNAREADGHARGLQRLAVRFVNANAALEVIVHLAVDVDTVVDADAHTKCDDGQGCDFHADAERCHQGLGEHGSQRKRYDDAHNGAP